MRALLLVTGIALGSITQAQDGLPKEAAEAMRIGKLLYRSEMASWFGTDVYQERFPEFRPGGYFSYANGDRTTCVFVDRNEEPRAIARFTFDSTFATSVLEVDTAQGPLSEDEQVLWDIRKVALELV